MGLIDRLASFAGFERRDAAACIDQSWAALSANTGCYPALSARAAENLSAVVAASQAISRALASVPIYVYRLDGDGNRTEQPSHPLARLVRSGVTPNQCWYDFIEHSLTSVLLQGNGLAVIQRDGGGQLIGLKYVPWPSVTVVQLSNQKLAFDVSDPATGKTVRYLQDECLHVKDRTDDGGKVGKSVLSRASEAVNVVHGTNSLAGSLLRNGAFPSGFLTAPGAISEATAARLKAQWDSNYARENAGKIAIAGDGLDWKSLSLSPENVELLESRRFGVLEIARIFGVPPIFCGDYSSSTFTNSETALRLFASFTLGQWAVKIQQEFSRSVLSAGYEMQFDLSAFLRGDPAARWSSYNIAIERSILTIDEVRAAEGYGPMPKDQGPVAGGRQTAI